MAEKGREKKLVPEILQKSKTIAIEGPSCAGKSTLLNEFKLSGFSTINEYVM